MDKINNISFKGISNIASVKIKDKSIVGSNLEKIKQIADFDNVVNPTNTHLSMVLTDDLKGSDLTEFKKYRNKVNLDLSNPNNPNVLNIELKEMLLEKAGNIIDKLNTFVLNGKPLQVERENMPIFTYLAKLTRKIGKMSKEEMVVNDTYKTCEARKNLIYGREVTEHMSKDVNHFFDTTDVKNRANVMNDTIQEMMESFFEIDK